MHPERSHRKIVRCSDGLGDETPVTMQATPDGRISMLVKGAAPVYMTPRQMVQLCRDGLDLAHNVLPRWTA